MMEECTQCKINRNAEPKKGTIISDRLGVRVYHLTVNFLNWQSRYLIIINIKIFKIYVITNNTEPRGPTYLVNVLVGKRM